MRWNLSAARWKLSATSSRISWRNTAETSARVAALERERDQVKSHDDIQTQRNELEKQRDELKSVLSYAEGLKIELSEELKAERLNAAALSKEYNDYKAAHTKSNEERSAEVEGIKKRASALAAQLAEGKRKYIEITKALTTSRQKIKRGSQMLQTHKAEIRELKEKNDVAECAADQAKARMRKAESALSKLKAVHKATGQLSEDASVNGKHGRWRASHLKK